MLPTIVAGSRPAVAGLAQRRHFDCNTSVDLLRLLHARITETPRSRVSFASTVLLKARSWIKAHLIGLWSIDAG
jgi:hypothetical protein